MSFGTPSIVSEVSGGKRHLTASHIRKLSERFHVRGVVSSDGTAGSEPRVQPCRKDTIGYRRLAPPFSAHAGLTPGATRASAHRGWAPRRPHGGSLPASLLSRIFLSSKFLDLFIFAQFCHKVVSLLPVHCLPQAWGILWAAVQSRSPGSDATGFARFAVLLEVVPVRLAWGRRTSRQSE